MELHLPLDTGSILSVCKMLRRLLDVLWTSYEHSVYVLCPGGKNWIGVILMQRWRL